MYSTHLSNVMHLKVTVDKQYLVSHSPFDRAVLIWKVVPPRVASGRDDQAALQSPKKRKKQ